MLVLFAAVAAGCLASDAMEAVCRMAALVSGDAARAMGAAADPGGMRLAAYEWFYLIIYLVLTLLSYALAPKPKIPKPEAPDPYGIDEFHVPTASAGREIPVVFGTRWVDSPNVVWYGHLGISEKKEKTCT